MSWIIIDDTGREITAEDILARAPNAVAYDESGFEVELDELAEDSEELADAGYGDRASRHILVWESEKASLDDGGSRAIAAATWE